MPAIGIDLGTTYSCVGVVDVNGEVKIIAELGRKDKTTPSYVSFTRNGCKVGHEAKAQLKVSPQSTVYNMKRIIGKKFEHPTLRDDIRKFPFDVENKFGRPQIKVPDRQGQSTFIPEEISGKVLKKMKEIAEKYLEQEVLNAVITIPANFGNAERLATREAASYAGLNVLRLLTEPTAAAIAYGFDKKSHEKRNLVVFDFGGGTLDVSVLTVQDETFDVKWSAGNTHLGGEDFDIRMVNKCIDKFAGTHGVNLSDNKHAWHMLREECEKTKRELSSITRASVEIEALHGGKNFSTTFSRAQFENMNEDIFIEALGHVKDALEEAKMRKGEIDEIILAGGSSRIPRIQAMLKEYFGKELCKSINPDEAIAYGAAIVAASLHGDPSREMKVNILDITPLPLGILTYGGLMSFLIQRCARIPAHESGDYTTVDDNQTSTNISVYEGLRAQTRLNDLLDNFVLEGIPPMFAGEPKIKVNFDLDDDGILTVSAEELSTGSKKDIKIQYNSITRIPSELDFKIREAERHKEDDEQFRRETQARNSLESLAKRVIRVVSGNNNWKKVPEAERSNLINRCRDIITRISQNNISAEEVSEKYQKILDAFSQH